MERVQKTKEKSFIIELSSDKSNSYQVIFNLNKSIEITANQIKDIIHKSFSNKFSFEEIRKNDYFLKFDTLDGIFDELKERINNQLIIKENEDNLIISIPLPTSKNKEIIFDLKQIIKNNNNERINELTDLIMKLNTEMNKINNEVILLKNEVDVLKNENIQLKNEIQDTNEKKTQIINIVNFLKNEVSQLKNVINNIKIENIKMKNNESLIKNKVSKIEQKSILFRTNIDHLDSKIINGNDNYIRSLKKWINPSRTIKVELLYRASENGIDPSEFHKSCDNKGPTLTLFHVNDGNIVGIYTPLSWDSNSGWINDMDTFIFNLNKNRKYKKIKSNYSIFWSNLDGP